MDNQNEAVSPGKKKLFKYAVLIIICVILLPVAPLIIGGVVIFSLAKASFSKQKKIGLITATAVLAFILTGKIINALPAPLPTPSPEVKSEQTASLAPEPSATPTPDPNISYAKVVNVVDGDTFKIDSGETVRLIGIDTPETVSPTKPVQCFGKEASDKLKELVEGKEIKLEKDVSEKDKYGRLLRYVYINDIFVNEYLVRRGFAMSSSYPPDIKYQEVFRQAQGKAQEESEGLWNTSVCPTSTPTPSRNPSLATPRPTSSISTTTTSPPIQSPSNNSGSFTCDCSKTCGQMASCSEAQFQLTECGCKKRDKDGDGIACDGDCQ